MTEYNPHQLPRVCRDIEKQNEKIWRLQKTSVITIDKNHWCYFNSDISQVHLMAIDWTWQIGRIRSTNHLSQAVAAGARAYILRRSYTPHHHGPGQRVEIHCWASLEEIWNVQSNRHTTGFGSCEFVDWAGHEPAAVWEHEGWSDLTPDLLAFFRA